MELIDLTVFISTAENRTTTAAAEHLGMTQPGISQHLARLETELGAKLFDRFGKRLILNDFGRVFLGKAKKLIDEINDLKDLSKGTSCPIEPLNLGLTDSSTLTVIPPALKKFKKLYPGVHIRMDVKDSSTIEHEILKGHYDLGVVTAGNATHPQLEEDILYYDDINALVSKDHPLAKKKIVSLKELSEHTLLLYPRTSRTRHQIDEAFHKEKIYPKDIIEVYFNTAAVRLAEAGIGVALLSEAFIKDELEKKSCVEIIIENDPIKRAICAARKKRSHLTESAKKFFEILSNEQEKQ